VTQVNDLSRSLTAFDPISTGTVTIDRAVAERGGACGPADQPDHAGL
jgi:hypothetical protein